MLLKSKISNIEIGSEDWFQARKARFTSSENYLLLSESSAALNYIYRKVGEELSGVPIRKEIETEATAHGNIYEMDGIRKYAQKHGLLNSENDIKYPFLVTQKLIYDQSERFSSTPDFIKVNSESSDKLSFDVEVGEVKCPLTYDAFITYSLCNTPLELKKVKKAYYYQILDQMLVCGSSKGVFIIYHPDFNGLSLKEINFNLFHQNEKGERSLFEDYKALKKVKDEAVDKFETIKNRLLTQ